MTLTESIEIWIRDAERQENATALGVVVSEELFAHLLGEQQESVPRVAGLVPFVADLSDHAEAVEITGPDRVCVYVGKAPEESDAPLGLDPMMPVVFVPLPPHALETAAQLEMYNRLRWYGLEADEAMTGSA